MLLEAVEKRATETCDHDRKDSGWQKLLCSPPKDPAVSENHRNAVSQTPSRDRKAGSATNSLPVRNENDAGHTTRILAPHARAMSRSLALRALFVAGLAIAVLQAGILWFAPKARPIVCFTNLPAELLEVRK